MRERLDKHRQKNHLTWEQLFHLIQQETGYPCPHGTWVGWLYAKGFPAQAEGVFDNWLKRKSAK